LIATKHYLLAGIYIHIPYCTKACHYCDFHFSTNTAKVQEMVDAICVEIKDRNKFFDPSSKIKTIYFGGGTPSILSLKQLDQLLKQITLHFSTTEVLEITLEANPENLSLENATHWLELGINRLSVGIQSFDESTLSFLNRSHTAKQSLKAIENAKKAGFDNLSLDLIFGIPTQEMAAFKYDLKQVIDLAPQHISTYGMTIEDKTVFGNRLKKGQISPISDELASQQYLMISDELSCKGFLHYEISNFGLPNYLSKHNTSYWQGVPFLGLGPSAHSYNGVTRFANVSSNAIYQKALSNGKKGYCQEEHLSQENKHNEYILTQLRTMWGVSLKDYESRFGEQQLAFLSKKSLAWQKEELIEIRENSICLSKNGKLVADSICQDLFI
jgi:oxygen-independent coproporphyrinogen III oxidase